MATEAQQKLRERLAKAGIAISDLAALLEGERRDDLRERLMVSILCGLAVNWKELQGESATKVVELADRLVTAAMKRLRP